MNVNDILVWLAVGATIVQGVIALGSARGGVVGWLVVSLLVLAGVWFARMHQPAWAGVVGIAAWAGLVGVPHTGAWFVERYGRRRDFLRAARMAHLVGFFHPMDGWPELSGRLSVRAALEVGDNDGACARLERMHRRRGRNQSWASALLYQHQGAWDVLLAWAGYEPAVADPRAHPAIFHAYLLAFGERGDLAGMAAAYAERYGRSPRYGKWRVRDQLVVAAFSGRDDLVFRILASVHAPERPEEQSLWLATANQVKGEPLAALADLERLIDYGPRDIAARALRRRAHPAPRAYRVNEAGELAGVLAGIAREHAFVVRADKRQPRPWATWCLMVSLAVAFVVELPGGSTDPTNLYELGMLVLPLGLADGAWWRFVTAGFLHFGPLHFIMNALALLMFGHTLERFMGPARFIAVYMVANVGAMAAVALFGGATMTKPLMIVGASGGVMGLLGAIMAVMLRALLERPERQRAARFMALSLLVALQLTFDAMTPMVSQTAHIGGLCVGLALALTLVPGRAIRRIVYPTLA